MKSILLKKEYVFQGNLILVNREYELKEKARDYNLKPFSKSYPNILFDYNANLELQKILAEIKAGDKIVPVSAYRSLKEQEKIWNDSLKENGENFTKQYVAYPNCSEHQTGLAIDLALNQENIDFIRPSFPYKEICQEFRKIMINYGFIERYTKDKQEITKISSEEWHFRYIGYPHSKIMQEMKLCLEEYIEYLKNFKLGKDCFKFDNYEISYIEMNEETKVISIDDNEALTISGNNIDGIIVTKRRK